MNQIRCSNDDNDKTTKDHLNESVYVAREHSECLKEAVASVYHLWENFVEEKGKFVLFVHAMHTHMCVCGASISVPKVLSIYFDYYFFLLEINRRISKKILFIFVVVAVFCCCHFPNRFHDVVAWSNCSSFTRMNGKELDNFIGWQSKWYHVYLNLYTKENVECWTVWTMHWVFYWRKQMKHNSLYLRVQLTLLQLVI